MSKTVDGASRVFVSLLVAVGQELVGQEVTEYFAGTGPTMARKRTVYGKFIDETIMTSQSGGNHFFHANSLFSVAALTDDLGGVIERCAYSVYGQAKFLAQDGTALLSSIAMVDGSLYAGRTFDAESALHYFRTRYFDAVMGRFISRDPIGYHDGLNLFEYVGGNPGGRIDPTGKWLLIDDIFTGPFDEIIVVGLVVVWISGIVSTGVATKVIPVEVNLNIKVCRECPPCPAPPSPWIRFDRVPPSAPHFPCPGNHTHVYWYEINQVPWPDCTCDNNLREFVECH